MTSQAHIDEAISDAKRQWFELDAEAVGWNLQRQFRVPKHIAAAIVEKFKSGEQWSRAQRVMLDSANKRIAWLESKVDPGLLNQKRETVSCKPPAEASD
jgi:hypothetical protein